MIPVMIGSRRIAWILFVVAMLSLASRASGAGMVGFWGDDLAVMGTPYALELPAGNACEVDWGDGSTDSVAAADQARRVSHIYRKSGVVGVAVRVRSEEGTWSAVPVDAAAVITAARPAFNVGGPIKTPVTLEKVLAEAVDSFSIECRVALEDARADQVLFASSDAGEGACRLGIRGGSFYFEIGGAGGFSAPIEKRIVAGHWHHLAVTYDRALLFRRSNRVRLFVDGQPAGTGVIAADDAGTVRCRGATIGGGGFKGKIDSLAVYDRLLFPLEVWEHARALAGETALLVTVAYPGAEGVKVEAPRISSTVEVALDPDPQADNGPALRKALAGAGAGTRIRVVGPDRTGGGRFFIRSLIEANKWAGLILEGKSDVELDGNGATLVISDKAARYLYVDRCQRVAIRNLSFDLDPAYARVGLYAKLLQVDAASQTVVAQLVKGRDGTPDAEIPRRASFWRWRPHDGRTLRIHGGGPHFDSGSYVERPAADAAAGPGVIRFKLKQDAGHKLWGELKTYMGGANFFMINNADFRSNAVSLMNSSHVTFEGVNYYATLGMVFLASSTDHLRVARCRIGLPPGLTAADRPLSSGSDGYHFHQMKGHIVFENNEMALSDDDPISLKDSVWTNVKQIGENRLELSKEIKAGSVIELLNPDYTPSGYRGTVTGVENGVVTLGKRLPDAIVPGSIAMDRSQNTTNWIIRDNYFHDYYGRVMLYADHGTFTGNRVHDSYYHLGNSTAYFEVAGACRNVITHRNLFELTNADSSHWGGDRKLASFHEITFSANSFVGKELKLNNTADALVARNAFYGAEAFVWINRSARMAVLKNLSFESNRAEFEVREKENSELLIEGNVVQSKD